MPFFSKVFKSKDDASKKKAAPVSNGAINKKPQWSDAWIRTRVDPEEVVELLSKCSKEIKSRGLDVPFLLLPFRPSSDPSAARTFVRNYFYPPQDRDQLKGSALSNELRMTEVMVLISVMKWCWARLPGGVVTWETYEMFKVGENDSRMARDSFTTFLPLSVDSNARVQIIQDFFDLLAAIAAHGKTNGLGALKLSRYAGWWAFGHIDTGKGFDAGYKTWESAADATSHLFFAYLRSRSPEGKTSGILGLPRSLQQLLDSSEYPPGRGFISNDTTKVVMIVDIVSPTPYALLRRAKNFEYRDSDRALQEFANYEDPVQALTDECRRVLNAISSTNQSTVSNAKTSTSLADPSWSRFEDIGFGSTIDEADEDSNFLGPKPGRSGAASVQGYYTDLARPTTPSWADFLSSGFAGDPSKNPHTPMLLSPDKILPPLDTIPRGQSSQSHRRHLETQPSLEPGELASIATTDLDDAFWWVWISSLGGEEPTSRKAVFGRCALIETVLTEGRWMVMEEQVKGAAPEPADGAYIAEKKRSFFGFTTKRGRLTRRRSGIKKGPSAGDLNGFDSHKTTLQPDQQARIQQAAAELTKKKHLEEQAAQRRDRPSENVPPSNRNSTFTLGPVIKSEVSPAMAWAKQYDKQELRAKYLGDRLAGKGSKELLTLPADGLSVNMSSTSLASDNKELPAPPAASNGDLTATEDFQTPTARSPGPRSPAPPVVVEPALTPPEPTGAVEAPVVEEAVNKPLPPPSPQPEAARPPSAPHQPKKLRKSQDAGRRSPEERREGKPPGPPPVKSGGIRKLFGTKKAKSKEPVSLKQSEAPQQSQPAAETNPAILAARRALEGKGGPPANSTSPPLSPNHFAKLKNVTGPMAAVQTVTEPAPTRNMPPPAREEPTLEPAMHEEEVESHPGPPKTRRDEEYDKLSRVDTNERENADREFSTFDQGPLDAPAFVPEQSPAHEEFHQPVQDETTYRPNHQSAYSAVTVPVEHSDEEEDDQDVTKQVSPSDRWAQIRKNAADRARQSEEQTNRSRTETRTDDGETSGEETIESRVARIKARVAELTGNMEASRR